MKNITAIHNMSDKILTENEISLLQKALNFNITRKPLSVQEIAPMIEPALQQLTNEESQSARQKISHILITQRNIPSNLTKQEYEALRNLKKDKSIVTTKTDRGNASLR
uniref:Uncharacterized protein n=1 Tax=Trichobilharzia regenti TaxID=157069 RepID=A0AA85KBU4_TRIRE|nr:unnamed protein product [Trichobilharzia regenti]